MDLIIITDFNIFESICLFLKYTSVHSRKADGPQKQAEVKVQGLRLTQARSSLHFFSSSFLTSGSIISEWYREIIPAKKTANSS